MNLNDSEDAYNKVNADEPHHKKSWTHELVAAAAGFAGKCRRQQKNLRDLLSEEIDLEIQFKYVYYSCISSL